MAQLEQDYKQAREKGTPTRRYLALLLMSFIEDGEDEWGLSNPNHTAVSEEDCDHESDEPRE